MSRKRERDTLLLLPVEDTTPSAAEAARTLPAADHSSCTTIPNCLPLIPSLLGDHWKNCIMETPSKDIDSSSPVVLSVASAWAQRRQQQWRQEKEEQTGKEHQVKVDDGGKEMGAELGNLVNRHRYPSTKIPQEEHTALLATCIAAMAGRGRPSEDIGEVPQQPLPLLLEMISSLGGCPDAPPPSFLWNEATASEGYNEELLRSRRSSDHHFLSRSDAATAISLCPAQPPDRAALLRALAALRLTTDGASVPAESAAFQALERATTSEGLLCLQPDRSEGGGDEPLGLSLRSSSPRSSRLVELHLGPTDTVLLAHDKRNGSTAKTFSLVSSSSSSSPPSDAAANVFHSIASIPNVLERNTYAVVDPSRAIHPFFDIDCSDMSLLPPALLQQFQVVNNASSSSVSAAPPLSSGVKLETQEGLTDEAALASSTTPLQPLSRATSEQVIQCVLASVLEVLERGLELYFNGGFAADRDHIRNNKDSTHENLLQQWAVGSWSIFSASVCGSCDPRPLSLVAGRCSFHLHAEMELVTTRGTTTAAPSSTAPLAEATVPPVERSPISPQPCGVFPTVKHHRDFAVWMQCTLRASSLARSSNSVLREEQQEVGAPTLPMDEISFWSCVEPWKLSVALQCVDWSVYTSWRAFRLPYCVKSPSIELSTSEGGKVTTSSSSASSLRRIEMYLWADQHANALQPPLWDTWKENGEEEGDHEKGSIDGSDGCLVERSFVQPSTCCLCGLLQVDPKEPLLDAASNTVATAAAAGGAVNGPVSDAVASLRFFLPFAFVNNKSLEESITTSAGRWSSRLASNHNAAKSPVPPGVLRRMLSSSLIHVQRNAALSNLVSTNHTSINVSDSTTRLLPTPMDTVRRNAALLKGQWTLVAPNVSAAASEGDVEKEVMPTSSPPLSERRVPMVKGLVLHHATFSLRVPSLPTSWLDDPSSSNSPSIDSGSKSTAAEQRNSRGPFPTGAIRSIVTECRVREEIARLFHALHPAYEGITPHTMRVFYEQADGYRAYYVTQKVSRYCCKQHREHRSTYVQLYLTYGSIKLRCYSNDCFQRCASVCWDLRDPPSLTGPAARRVPWTTTSAAATEEEVAVPSTSSGSNNSPPLASASESSGAVVAESKTDGDDEKEQEDDEDSSLSFPQFAVLATIRGQLFEELSAEELARFYGVVPGQSNE